VENSDRQETIKAVLHYFYQNNAKSGSHFRIIAMEVMPDHVHMLIEAPPKVSPTRIIQTLKSISARRMRMEFDKEIQKYIWKPGTLWAVGYYVGSVSDKVTTEIVQEYIKNQKAKKQRLIEFEERLDQKGLFDEN
jgi:putative transposase